ncbi:MFS transporter [Bacillus chungangensis]|uniref:MFS transporter n=1 Tax=Bacillus chungangensis TaxID=587633 RepID=UPI0027D7F544|nr:MFS transporter [Bacillus chungangensis]
MAGDLVRTLTDRGTYKWFILFIATFAQACATFVTYGMGPLATFYQSEFHLSQLETGLIVSAVNIGPIFSMIFFGDLMDKYGERWTVGLGAILLGLSITLAYFWDSFGALLIILLFVGIWYGTAQPGGSSAIVKWFPNKNRGLAMGIRQTGIPLGGAAASIVLPFIFYHHGLHSAILMQGLVSIIGGIIFLLCYKDINRSENKRKTTTLKEKIKIIQNTPSLYPVFYIGISMISVQLIIVAHLMSYLNKGLHIGLSQSGILLSIALIGGMLGRIVLSWISDHLFRGNRSKPLQLAIYATVITIVAFILTPHGSNDIFIGSLCFIFGFLGMGWFSLFIVMVSEKAHTEMIALTVSVALTLNQLFIVAAPATFGFIVDITGSYTIPFLLLAVFIAIGPIWLNKTERMEKRSSINRQEEIG